MKEDSELISVPGFGFYRRDVWQRFDSLRQTEGGNKSDMDVCEDIQNYWINVTTEPDKYCPPQWDGVAACIPSAPRGEIAVLPCIKFYDDKNGTKDYFDTSYNITKVCLDDGSWNNFTNYEDCLNNIINPFDWEIFIFLLGYSVSIISLLFAIFIFMYFREMKCLRHKIHLNLFLSVLTANLDWIIIYAVQHFLIEYHKDADVRTISTINCILHVLLRYFQLTNFFWMFVEGLFLFLQVQASFSVGRLKLRHCASVGWGAPLVLTLIWTLLIYCQSQTQVSGHINTSVLGCPFVIDPRSKSAKLYERYGLYTYTVPVCLLLAANFVFSIWIMGVVISKLRSNDVHHTTQNINLRAAKALIIIVPLLGITYLVTIVGPSTSSSTLATIFILTRTGLLSFQGFFITLPYCFLNGEVCTMIKTHWDRWRDRNNIGYGPASARNSIAMQGMYNVNEARKRSSYGYHTVTTVTTVGEDRRGTQETQETVQSGGGNTPKLSKPRSGSGQTISWKSRDGPLVPQPDLVQHSQSADSRHHPENI